MKKKLIAMIVLAVVLMLGTAATSFAADTDKAEGYDYTVFVYSGNQGTLGGNLSGDSKTEWHKSVSQGEVVTFNLNDVNLPDNSKYYKRGFKIAGHDNDETFISPQITFNGGRDVSYVVSYAIKGDLVPYKVKYQLTNGTSLGSDTFYGMIGDKPVVSFKYFEGYLPDAYDKSKTIVGDESKDVFTFTYSKAGTGTNQTGQDGDQNGQNGNNNGNHVAGANGGLNAYAPGTADNPAGTNTAAIGDNAVPFTDIPQYEDLDDKGGLGVGAIVGIVAGALALIALIALLVARKRRQSEM